MHLIRQAYAGLTIGFFFNRQFLNITSSFSLRCVLRHVDSGATFGWNCVHILLQHTCEAAEEHRKSLIKRRKESLITAVLLQEERRKESTTRIRLTAPVCTVSCSSRRHWRVNVAPQSVYAQLNSCSRGTASSFLSTCAFIIFKCGL